MSTKFLLNSLISTFNVLYSLFQNFGEIEEFIKCHHFINSFDSPNLFGYLYFVSERKLIFLRMHWRRQ